MSKRDYYEVLGVDRSATPDEIKKAYRRKARELHPDTNQDNPDAGAQFKEVNEAYDCLKDEQKKANFDRFGHDGVDHQPPPRHDYTRDVFNSEWMRRPRAQAMNNVQGNIGVPIDIMINGGSIKVPFNIPKLSQQGQMFGMGYDTVVVPVVIPPETPVGSVIQMTPEQHGIDGVNLVVMRVLPERPGPGQMYQVNGDDIHVQLQVDVFDSMFAEEVEVELPTKKTVRVNLPEGIDTGKSIRLSGQGLPIAGGTRGDCYLVVSISIPLVDPETRDKLYEILHPSEG